jgi:hypothetical protein
MCNAPKRPYGAVHVVCTGPCEQVELASVPLNPPVAWDA